MSRRKRTKRARFSAIAKIRRQNRAAARLAHVDLILFGTCMTYWDGDRFKRIAPSEFSRHWPPAGTRVEIAHGDRDQRAITSIWYDELAKLTRAG